MISKEQALQIILNTSQNFGVETIPFLESVGRILKEEVKADRDFPPFNRVAMDGIAINYSQFEKGQRSFLIEGIQAAGSEQMRLNNPENCIEVMTGAVLPSATSAVIRYEDIQLESGIATIVVDALNDGQNIHEKGKDGTEDAVLIHKNTKISAAEIGVLATVGKPMVKVAKTPKVMIVSTGDELVGVEEIPLPHQIRRSNVFTLVSLLDKLQVTSHTAHITDDKPVLKQKIKGFLKTYDVLLFSGAVSKGKYDFLPEVLDELGVEKLFHKVAQRPGKPFWFGHKTTSKIAQNAMGKDAETHTDKNSENTGKEKTTVFAFPGNPISTFVNCLTYFFPWYDKSLERLQEQETAVLGHDVTFKPALTYFLQVRLSVLNGRLVATPIKGNGSGDLASLAKADGFIELPKTEETLFMKGAVFPIIRYRN